MYGTFFNMLAEVRLMKIKFKDIITKPYIKEITDEIPVKPVFE